jgi:uncharacterized membrane protein YphA (DoxX/SURF4 family)
MKSLFLVGRLIFGGYFLFSGIDNFENKRSLVHFARAKNMPNPEMAVVASGVMLLAGGTSVILGLKPKLGMLPVIGFLAVASPSVHDFWHEQDPQSRQLQLAHFTKNMGLIGALVALMAVEEWPLSVSGS